MFITIDEKKRLLPEKLFFFTLKHPKWQKMDKIRKHISKISKHFIIVREPNITTPGYHFHVIFRSKSKPKRNWFRKGVHMNLRQHGVYGDIDPKCPSNGPPPTLPNLSKMEIMTIPDQELQNSLMADYVMEQQINNCKKEHEKNYKKTSIDRLIKYVSKNLNENSQKYIDYYVYLK